MKKQGMKRRKTLLPHFESHPPPHFGLTLISLINPCSYFLTHSGLIGYPGKTDKPKRTLWLDERCQQLKHQSGIAEVLIREMEALSRKTSLTKTVKADLRAALTYFRNHRHMMDYATHTQENLPVGSGVTEAACKTLVKQRICGSGMRWKNQGAKVILSLRAR